MGGGPGCLAGVNVVGRCRTQVVGYLQLRPKWQASEVPREVQWCFSGEVHGNTAVAHVLPRRRKRNQNGSNATRRLALVDIVIGLFIQANAAGYPSRAYTTPYKASGGSGPRQYRDVGLLIGGQQRYTVSGLKDPQRPTAYWEGLNKPKQSLRRRGTCSIVQGLNGSVQGTTNCSGRPQV